MRPLGKRRRGADFLQLPFGFLPSQSKSSPDRIQPDLEVRMSIKGEQLVPVVAWSCPEFSYYLRFCVEKPVGSPCVEGSARLALFSGKLDEFVDECVS